MTKMGRQLICPRATQNQIASNHPKVNLYVYVNNFSTLRKQSVLCFSSPLLLLHKFSKLARITLIRLYAYEELSLVVE